MCMPSSLTLGQAALQRACTLQPAVRGQAETTLSTVFFPLSALLSLQVCWFLLGTCL